ncbi:tatD [Mytilus coruscus]|uniref:TatD n=1 Tax=Mytilus coruscus TaxID=42192 RepID=A0A6J8DHS9_MYTCO|nr:tatD [Mytilus coruscus]
MLENHCLELHNCNIADNTFKEEQQSVWTELMNGLLLELCQRYDKKTLDHLVDYVRTEAVFEQCQSAVFHWTDIPLLKFYNKKNRFDVEAIMVTDSHFHLDKIKQQARFSGLSIYKWNDGESVYQIRHLVANCAFPRRWPAREEMEEIRKDRRIRTTAGIHPRIVKGEMSVLNSMLAVRECGLDSSDNPNNKELKKQVHVFEEQLRIAKRQHLPVVIHCRGDKKLKNMCRDSLSNFLEEDHPIHWHCFNGDMEEYRQCETMFPNGKFGISPFLLMDNKYPSYRSTVCELDLKDLVLETDSPYLHPQGYPEASPELLKDIIWKLASMFDVPSEDIARVTTRNARQLYNID